ncbi:MAG TPA: hypothetical protein V6D16_11755 [Candidatus Obscuribacterales bacterium]
MVKNKYQKTWELNHPEKVKQYTQNYLQDKVKATVILQPSVRDAIDKVKDSSQPYGAWIRQFLEDWAKTQSSSEL